MKLVRGLSWRDLLHPKSQEQRASAAQLTLEDHLDILLKVCDAVGFAHGKGILHRDLKPENIMVGAYGEVLVMDWGCGIAFGESEHHPVVPRVEEVAEICGTPSYIAPEMALMDTSRMGAHSDVYLLGGLLYEILTRKKPHRGRTVPEVLLDAASGRIQPPQEAAPDAAIPDELAAIAMAALEKDVRVRIGSVEDFSARVKAYRAHAQAVSLSTSARAHLARAMRKQDPGEDSFRRAVSAAEQAVEIWPTWSPARRILIEATLAWASHHHQQAAHAQAVAEAKQAAGMAADLGLDDLAANARALLGRARAAHGRQSARQRQLRIARIGLACAGMALLVVATVVVVLVSAAQRRTRVALAKAQSALEELTGEQSAHAKDQRTAAPALVAEARKQLEVHDWDGAIRSLAMAASFDPGMVEPRALLANTLAVAGRYQEAIAATKDWAAHAPDSDLPGRLADACSTLHDELGTVKLGDAKVALARIFDAQRLDALTEATDMAPSVRLALYRSHIEQAWPGASVEVTMRSDGKLQGFLIARKLIGRQLRSGVKSLESLRGMPFASLDLREMGFSDLSPLAGMPLEYLTLSGCKVLDLQALRGMPLRFLAIENTEVSNLAPLANSPLESLVAAHSLVHDLSPLRSTQVHSLNVLFCPLTDLSMLRSMQVRILRLSLPNGDLSMLRGTQLSTLVLLTNGHIDLAPLADCPLTDVELDAATPSTLDISDLPRSVRRLALSCYTFMPNQDLLRWPLTVLSLTSAANQPCVPDLAKFDLTHIEHLILHHCQGMDITRLAHMHLLQLDIDDAGSIDISALATMKIDNLLLNSSMTAASWRSLAILSRSACFRQISYNGTQHSADEFWGGYDPDHPPAQ